MSIQNLYETKSPKNTEFRNPLSIYFRTKKKSIRNSKNQENGSYLPGIHLSPLKNEAQNIKQCPRKSTNPKNLLLLHKFQSSLNKNSTPADLCIYALFNRPKQRSEQEVQFIKNYLLSLKSFMNILSKEKNSANKEILIEQIARNMKHEKISKNNIISQYGEKGYKFYIILKGEITFLVPKLKQVSINEESYINYLIKLKTNNERELINKLLYLNFKYFPIKNNDLDLYLQTILNEHKKNFSNKTYKNIKLLLAFLEDKKNDNRRNSIYSETVNKYSHIMSVQDYIKMNNVFDDDEKIEGRQLIQIYYYEESSCLKEGDSFGFVALENKNHKRSATAITNEDTDLGVITNNSYINFLEINSSKEKQQLYDLLIFYNLINDINKEKFIQKYSHMFEFMKYEKDQMILEENKLVNYILIFKSGIFTVSICKNIIEINELIIKLKKIKKHLSEGKNYEYIKDLPEIAENEEIILNQNFMSSEKKQILFHKYNFSLSIISDHFVIGFNDTVDPITKKSLFNCQCLSAEANGYIIYNKYLDIINKDNNIIQDFNNFSLVKIDYNLKRLERLKNEILQKTKIVNSYGNNQGSLFSIMKRNNFVINTFENKNKKENKIDDENISFRNTLQNTKRDKTIKKKINSTINTCFVEKIRKNKNMKNIFNSKGKSKCKTKKYVCKIRESIKKKLDILEGKKAISNQFNKGEENVMNSKKNNIGKNKFGENTYKIDLFFKNDILLNSPFSNSSFDENLTINNSKNNDLKNSLSCFIDEKSNQRKYLNFDLIQIFSSSLNKNMNKKYLSNSIKKNLKSLSNNSNNISIISKNNCSNYNETTYSYMKNELKGLNTAKNISYDDKNSYKGMNTIQNTLEYNDFNIWNEKLQNRMLYNRMYRNQNHYNRKNVINMLDFLYNRKSTNTDSC